MQKKREIICKIGKKVVILHAFSIEKTYQCGDKCERLAD